MTPEHPTHVPALWRPVAEWLVWLGIAGLAWSQTGYFDETIPGYIFGATGWPRVICLMIVAGATFQLGLRLFGPAGAGPAPAARGARPGAAQILQRLAILGLPFLFLWAVDWAGFYVATPGFVVLLMLLLEVRAILPILGVAAVIEVAVLAIFTRFFYVALPLGRWDWAYDLNAQIVDLARIGM